MKTKILFIAALWPLALPSGWAETSRVFGYDAHKVTEEVDQQQRIVGRVIDAKTNEPLMGAAVILQQANEGTVTDIEGNFTLQTRQKAPYFLQVQYIGYHSQIVEVSEAGKTIEIRLVEDSQQLNEVVVVGYGTQKRKELTGAIASVDKELLAQPITNFDNLLGGAVSGLQVSESSGLPGASSNIRIRGGNSITGGNEPLYVIDGVLIYNDKSATSTGVTRATSDFNPLSAINPNDIERIEVLKDVSATAIYGSRGANGVIIVTTKSGKKGRTSIEYQYAIGWQKVAKKLDLLNAREWGDLYLEIATPTQIANSGLTPEIVAAWGEGDDWQSAALRTATTQNHQLSISGGDERTRYLISGNFSDQDGILVNTGFKRYSGRVNFERDLYSNLTVGINLTASKTEQRGITDFTSYNSYVGGNSNAFEYLIRIPQAVPIYNADGSYNHNNPYEVGDLRNGDVTPNALADLTEVTSINKSNNLIGNAFAKWEFLPGLTLKLSASTNLVNSTQNFYSPGNSSAGITVGGYGTVGNKRFDAYQYEATLNWQKEIGKHRFDILGGYTSQVTDIEYAVASAESFANDALSYHSLQTGALLVPPETGGSKNTVHSALGRVNYTFNNRYNLTATLRADGSSRFAENNRWAYFPSLGLSWNVNEEGFLQKATAIDELKLRASIGTVGNQEIGDYKALATYGTTRTYFGNTAVTGYVRNNLENPDLKWETTVQYSVGFDLGLLQRRLSFVFDTYYKKTSDLLLSIPVEQTTGFSTQLQNVGNVTNKGVEFSVSGTPVQTKDFDWSISANIAHNQNEVTNIGSLDYILSGSQIIQKGEPLGAFYGWQYDGLVQPGEDLSKVPVPSPKPNVEYGDAKFVDQNGDGEITQTADRVVLGSIQPDFTYGLSTTLRYKDWSLFASFQGSQGNEIYNSLRQRLESPSTSYNGSRVLLDRWSESNLTATQPKAYASNNYSNYVDSRYIEDASYFRLKNVTLSYFLPIHWQRAQQLKVKLFLSANNLFTLTGYKGYDPEVASGVDAGAYPTARTYTVGANISF